MQNFRVSRVMPVKSRRTPVMTFFPTRDAEPFERIRAAQQIRFFDFDDGVIIGTIKFDLGRFVLLDLAWSNLPAFLFFCRLL